MPKTITQATIREVEPLRVDDTVGQGARRIIDLDLPALPVVDEDGRFAGIFGEREFMTALFPGYVGQLASARVVSKDIDATIERREACRTEPISDHMTTDHVVVDEDHSDTELAETFLHHRVLIVPVARDGRVRGLVTRNDFFKALAERLGVEPTRR
jgi:CBS domain-containing protein